MNEWDVVVVIIALVGLFFAIYTPMRKGVKEEEESRRKNTEATTELTVTMKIFIERFDKFETKNSQSHERIWNHNENQDIKLEDHETRLRIIEKEK